MHRVLKKKNFQLSLKIIVLILNSFFSKGECESLYSSASLQESLSLNYVTLKDENSAFSQDKSVSVGFDGLATLKSRQADLTNDLNFGLNSSLKISKDAAHSVSVNSQYVRSSYLKNTELNFNLLALFTQNENTNIPDQLYLLRPNADTRTKAVTGGTGLSISNVLSEKTNFRSAFNFILTRDNLRILKEWNGQVGLDNSLSENMNVTFQLQGSRTQRQNLWTDILTANSKLRRLHSEKWSSVFSLGMNQFVYSRGNKEQFFLGSIESQYKEKDFNFAVGISQESSPRKSFGPIYYAHVASVKTQYEINRSKMIYNAIILRNEIGSPGVQKNSELSKGMGVEIGSVWNLSTLRAAQENGATEVAGVLRPVEKHEPNSYGCSVKLSAEFAYARSKNGAVSQQRILKTTLNYSF